jgi:hypothetical protein
MLYWNNSFDHRKYLMSCYDAVYVLTEIAATQSFTLSRRALYLRDFVANMHYDDIPRAKNDALPASCAKLSAQH